MAKDVTLCRLGWTPTVGRGVLEEQKLPAVRQGGRRCSLNGPFASRCWSGWGLLLLLVLILSSTGLYATYAYRGLAKGLSWRAVELPLAAELGRQVAEMRMTLSELRGLRASSFPSSDGKPPAVAGLDGSRPLPQRAG